MHIPAQSCLDSTVIAYTWNHIILREVFCCLIEQQIMIPLKSCTTTGLRSHDSYGGNCGGILFRNFSIYSLFKCFLCLKRVGLQIYLMIWNMLRHAIIVHPSYESYGSDPTLEVVKYDGRSCQTQVVPHFFASVVAHFASQIRLLSSARKPNFDVRVCDRPFWRILISHPHNFFQLTMCWAPKL